MLKESSRLSYSEVSSIFKSFHMANTSALAFWIWGLLSDFFQELLKMKIFN